MLRKREFSHTVVGVLIGKMIEKAILKICNILLFNSALWGTQRCT